MLCPCRAKSNAQNNDQSITFSNCCQPIIEQRRPAQNAEQLMRSRYSAYATQNADYILQTYAEQPRKKQTFEEIADWAKQCQWLGLQIHQSQMPDANGFAYVEFSATYIQDKQIFAMRENSRFIQEQGLWRYLDGDISSHQLIKTPKRNQACLCGSGKKFKQCCLNKL